MTYVIVATIAQVGIALLTMFVCMGADLCTCTKKTEMMAIAIPDTTEASKTWQDIELQKDRA